MKAIKLNGVTYKYSVSDKKTWEYSENYYTTDTAVAGGQDAVFVQIYKAAEKFAEIKVNDFWHYLGSSAMKQHHYSFGDIRSAYLGSVVRKYIQNAAASV
jgi:hypothetical protein